MEELKKGVGREYDSADSVHCHVLCHPDHGAVKKDKVDDPENRNRQSKRTARMYGRLCFWHGFFCFEEKQKTGQGRKGNEAKTKGNAEADW